jgi:hypothetical protein
MKKLLMFVALLTVVLCGLSACGGAAMEQRRNHHDRLEYADPYRKVTTNRVDIMAENLTQEYNPIPDSLYNLAEMYPGSSFSLRREPGVIEYHGNGEPAPAVQPRVKQQLEVIIANGFDQPIIVRLCPGGEPEKTLKTYEIGPKGEVSIVLAKPGQYTLRWNFKGVQKFNDLTPPMFVAVSQQYKVLYTPFNRWVDVVIRLDPPAKVG